MSTYVPSFPNLPFGPPVPNALGALNRGTKFSWFSGSQMVAQAGTTDGTTSEIFFGDVAHIGTFTATSTQAGYEGEAVSTTGNSSGDANSFVGTAGVKLDAGQYIVAYTSFFMPDPNVAAHSFWFGMFNKQVDPSNTGPTDGFWITGATVTGAIAMVGKSANNSTVTTSATIDTIAAGAGRSVELAVALDSNRAVFATRDPRVAGNPWITLASVANANIPRTSVIMRPHLVHYTNTAATNAYQIRDLGYWWYRPGTW